MIAGFIAISYFTTPTPVQYHTLKVVQKDLQQNVLATGKLDAVRKVDVGAQVSGQLQHLYVKIGDKVQQGQLLALIDPKQAQNQIKEVEATLQDLNAQLLLSLAEQQLAKMTLDRQRKLVQSQATPEQELDKASTELAVSVAKVATIKAKINKTTTSLDTAKLNLDYTKISAPMSGEVVQITTLEGQTVIASQQVPTILTLADMNTMLVNAQVSEADVIHLKPGLKASFTMLGDRSKRFNGVLKDILPTPEKVNDAIFYIARFEVRNPNAVLRLQMTAQISIQLIDIKQATVIPLAALGESLGDDYYQVAVLVNNKEEKRKVRIGIRNDVDVQIIEGLKVNEDIILSRSGQEEE